MRTSRFFNLLLLTWIHRTNNCKPCKIHDLATRFRADNLRYAKIESEIFPIFFIFSGNYIRWMENENEDIRESRS